MIQLSEAIRSEGAGSAASPRQVRDAADLASSMPFIGHAAAVAPDYLVVERVLDLSKDRHLADHAFVHAPGVKPLSACLPVLPMTMSLEAMAEVAACLAPGLGLVAVEDVTASRWIELADTERLLLQIEARRVSRDAAGDALCIRAAIRPEGQDAAAISAALIFAKRYRAAAPCAPKPFDRPYRLALTGDEIYRRRHLFHGPSYRCLSGDIVLGDAAAWCEMAVPSPAGLFDSNATPQLLLDPQLLDAVGQLLGVWAMERERYVFPIGLAKLELYGPTPPPGARVAVRVDVTADSGKTLEADMEVSDGSGGLWMRLQGWRMWKFRWDRRWVDFRRAPARAALSRPYALAPRGVGREIDASDFSAAEFDLLARFYLHVDEMSEFRGKAGVPQRQRQWLLGRIAAKDALRDLWARTAGGEAEIHPAALIVAYDDKRRPMVDPKTLPSLPGADQALPSLSITHCGDRVIAVADTAPVGIDLERIATRDDAFAEAAFSPAERGLLAQVAQGAPATLDEWTTRLWCAKEAAGKFSGVGLDGAPRRLEAVALAQDGGVDVRFKGEDRTIRVVTLRDGDHIFACA